MNKSFACNAVADLDYVTFFLHENKDARIRFDFCMSIVRVSTQYRVTFIWLLNVTSALKFDTILSLWQIERALADDNRLQAGGSPA
jgi:hypothetical protein